MWIYLLHAVLTVNNDLSICLSNSYWPWSAPISSGDLGVDAFFVLSGFLISYTLMKKMDKEGDINVFDFYRSRFLRIWPALSCAVMNQLIGSYLFNAKIITIKLLSCLIFINNLVVDTTTPTHYWSVAVEMHFYLISPFIIRHFHKTKRPWILVLALSLISTILGYLILFLVV